jgi:hypothetical protein
MHKKMPNKKLASDYNKNPHARDILAARRRTKSTKKWRWMALHSSPSSLFEFWKVSVIAVFVVQIIQVRSLTA